MTGLSLAAGNKSASQEERGNDLYETPAVATLALARAEKLPHHIWECACGHGAMVKVLRSLGHTVWASDIIDYGGLQHETVDFLSVKQARIDTEAIVTNPPFSLAAQFVEHALCLAPTVMMLLRLNFMEGGNKNSAAGIARRNVLNGGRLARVHVFANRLPMMHRAGYEGPKASSGMTFAWFIWDRFHKGLATIDRISWLPIAANDNGVSIGDAKAA